MVGTPGEVDPGSQTPKPTFIWQAIAFLAALLAVRIPFLLSGTDVQLAVIVDDAYYYLEAARRSLETHAWPNMDGIHATNGFHPLYMAIVVGLEALAGTDPARSVSLVLGTNLLLNALATVLLVRQVLRTEAAGHGGALPAMAAGVLAGLTPGWFAHGLSGVETSLSSLLLLILALRWRNEFSGEAPRPGGGPARAVVDGLIAGLAVLARTDSVLFVGIGLLWLVLARRRSMSFILVTGGLALLLSSPWWISSFVRFGTLAQDSGASIAARTSAIAGPVGSRDWIVTGGTNLAFWIYRLGWLWGFHVLTGWLTGMVLPIDRLRGGSGASLRIWALPALCALSFLLAGNDLWYIDRTRVAALELGFGALGLLGGLSTPRMTNRLPRAWGWLLASWVALLAVLYSFGLKSFQVWYTTAPSWIALGLMTLPAFVAMARRHRPVAALVLVLVASQAMLKIQAYRTRGGFEGLIPNVLAAADPWRETLERHAPVTSGQVRVGSFDSGRMSFLVHPYPIVNLDGVMNHEASRALRERRIGPYLQALGLEYVISPESRIATFQRVSPFDVRADSAFTRALGHPVFRIVR